MLNDILSGPNPFTSPKLVDLLHGLAERRDVKGFLKALKAMGKLGFIIRYGRSGLQNDAKEAHSLAFWTWIFHTFYPEYNLFLRCFAWYNIRLNANNLENLVYWITFSTRHMLKWFCDLSIHPERQLTPPSKQKRLTFINANWIQVDNDIISTASFVQMLERNTSHRRGMLLCMPRDYSYFIVDRFPFMLNALGGRDGYPNHDYWQFGGEPMRGNVKDLLVQACIAGFHRQEERYLAYSASKNVDNYAISFAGALTWCVRAFSDREIESLEYLEQGGNLNRINQMNFFHRNPRYVIQAIYDYYLGQEYWMRPAKIVTKDGVKKRVLYLGCNMCAAKETSHVCTSCKTHMCAECAAKHAK